MFTRLQWAMLLAFTMMVAFLSAFFFLRPQMSDQVHAALTSFAPLDQQLQQIEEQLGEAANTSNNLERSAWEVADHLLATRTSLSQLIEVAIAEKAGHEAERERIERLLAESALHNQRSQDALDLILSNMLGEPIGQNFGERSTIKVFTLEEAGYRGYMAKVKLHDPSAVQLTLSGGKVGHTGETTRQAAARTNAMLAVNGGGFARQDGVLYPIGITVVDGEIKTFYQTDLSFIGFDKNGNLVGGEVTTREQIEEMNIMHGASFVPTLLQDGKKLPIPAQWANRKEPRTLIGHFSNGDLLFIVIDGRQKGHSEGVTLEEAQEKLLEFNVRDAYNLDGGGSSTFYYDGKVLNSPSDGRQRRMPTHIVILP